ncbi:MAG: DNA replication/repair protein RecF [Chlamydiales bacterium]
MAQPESINLNLINYMKLNRLFLKNFRNYTEQAFSFAPSVNYIFGDNAQGKTNLLEAIYLLITGRSFCTPHLQDLVRFGEESFYIEGHFTKNGVDQVLKMHYAHEKRKIFYNATPLTSLSSLFGILQGVILTPEDHLLLTGNPKLRRHFLDLGIAQTNPLYLHHLNRYQKAMKQRNALLRAKKLETVEIWEEQMAASAHYLMEERSKCVKELAQALEEFPFDPLELTYLPSCPNDLSGQLARNRTRDMLLGSTSFGPHRDDLSILLRKKQARYFASEGQKRSTIAALKFAEWKRVQKVANEPPLLCIDDLGVSFDEKREKQLLQFLQHFGQVFVTHTKINSSLIPEACLLQIEDGNGYNNIAQILS